VCVALGNPPTTKTVLKNSAGGGGNGGNGGGRKVRVIGEEGVLPHVLLPV